nr:MAG TPA: hypothetical protein [Caudoviricetes sp.]
MLRTITSRASFSSLFATLGLIPPAMPLLAS